MPTRLAEFGDAGLFPFSWRQLERDLLHATSRLLADMAWVDHLTAGAILAAQQGQRETAFRVMRSIKDEVRRTAIMAEFVKLTLSDPEDAALFDDLIQRTGEFKSLRNRLAHWLWFAVPGRRDLLALVRPIHLSADELAEYLRAEDGQEPAWDLAHFKRFYQNAMKWAEVYPQRELEEFADGAFALRKSWKWFHTYLAAQSHQPRKALWREIVRAELVRIPRVVGLPSPQESQPGASTPGG